MSDKVKLNQEYQFSYPALSEDDIYVLAKNEFLLQDKIFILMGEMKFKYKIPKIIPMFYSDDRHFFLFKPKLLGIYLLEVYKNNLHVDTLNLEVI
jgi:hypothetical protein